jgi:hypothetical protein
LKFNASNPYIDILLAAASEFEAYKSLLLLFLLLLPTIPSAFERFRRKRKMTFEELNEILLP